MITLECCGEKYYTDEQHAGHWIKCRKCGRQMLLMKTTEPPGKTTSARPNKKTPWLKIAGMVGGLAVFGTIVGIIGYMAGLANNVGTKTKEARNLERPTAPRDTERHPTFRATEPNDEPVRPPVSLRTGTWVFESQWLPVGEGVLKIRNGTSLDAAVKLVSVDTPRSVFWMIYIKGLEETTVRRIATGSYLLRFALGQDWDTERRKFLRSNAFYQMGEQLIFTGTEPTEYRAGQYTELDITLNEVVGGNIRRVGISEAEFDEGLTTPGLQPSQH